MGRILVGSLESLQAVPFDYQTPSPLALEGVDAGDTFEYGAVLITTPFDAPAVIRLGNVLDPGLVLGAGQVDAQEAGQYESDAFVIFPVPEFLQLTIAPGAATQGAGVVYYKVKR